VINKVAGLVIGMMLLVAGGTNVSLIASILRARVEIRSIRAAYGAPVDGRAARFVGVDVNGGFVDLSASKSGIAVWYASKNCPYCKRDQEWPTLAADLQAKGVRIVVLSPRYAHRFPPGEIGLSNVLEVPFVAGEWLAQFPLSVTPTLLVFDGEQRLVFYKLGMLNKRDSIEVLRIADGFVRGNVTSKVSR
jgi:hypothetical protein